MANNNSELLNALSAALKKEFEKRFTKRDFSTCGLAFKGKPTKMHGGLAQLRKPDGTVNLQAVSRMTHRAVTALVHLKRKKRLRFYPAIVKVEENKTANVVAVPPARIALLQDEIGFVFHIKAYA